MSALCKFGRVASVSARSMSALNQSRRIFANDAYADRSHHVEKKINSVVSNQQVVVFMHGTPDLPTNENSEKIAEVLNNVEGLHHYTYIDVEDSTELQAGVKKFTGFSALPQLFVGGEFVGGVDAVVQMQKKGGFGGLCVDSNYLRYP